MIKTDAGARWQNILGIIVAAAVFHGIDHGKHLLAVIAWILGLVALRLWQGATVSLSTADLCEQDFVCDLPVTQPFRLRSDPSI